MEGTDKMAAAILASAAYEKDKNVGTESLFKLYEHFLAKVSAPPPMPNVQLNIPRAGAPK